MKIKVADLRPNPFREIGKYPIDKAKVERLKLSIRETSFWDNVLCRQSNGIYEIAYGHHRLEALKGLGINEVNIPVKKLTDAQMVRIMAEENLEWLTSPAVVYQTVMTVKKYLDEELAKTDTMSDLPQGLMNLLDLKDKRSSYENLKTKGVGQPTILKFLGGNWKPWMIQSALNSYHLAKEKILDPKAVIIFDRIEHADNFKRAVKNLEIPVKEQLKIAKKVKKNIDSKKISSQGRTKTGKTRPSIADNVAELVMPIPNLKKPQKRKCKPLPNVAEFVNSCEADADNLNRRINALRPDLKEMTNNSRIMGRLISALTQLHKTTGYIIDEYQKEKIRRDSVICEGESQ